MAAPSVTQSTISNANGNSLTNNSFTMNIPALSTASDGYLAVIANANANEVVSIYDPSHQLIWSEINGFANFGPGMVSGTYSISVWCAPLPGLLGTAPQTFGGGAQIVNYSGAADSIVWGAFGVVGDEIPCWLFFDRGVPNGPVFFVGDNQTGSDLLQYSTNTYDTLQLCVTISDDGGLGGATPDGFTKIGGAAIWVNNYLQMTLAYKQTTGSAITNAKLSWQQSTRMANMVWSMTSNIGVGSTPGAGDTTQVSTQNRSVGRNRLISPVMR